MQAMADGKTVRRTIELPTGMQMTFGCTRHPLPAGTALQQKAADPDEAWLDTPSGPERDSTMA